MITTKVAGLDHIVAWDDSEQHHVYLDGGDLVFRDNESVHVGPGYAGPVDTTIDGNLRTTFLACTAAMPLLEAGEDASLVNIASGLAQFIRPHYGPYAAAKAGMIALTKTLAHEHAPKVRCNVVAPGAVDTAFLRGGTGRSDEQQQTTIDVAAYGAMIPLNRIAVPDDIVGPILFLLGPGSRYMTGQSLWVNGGAYMP